MNAEEEFSKDQSPLPSTDFTTRKKNQPQERVPALLHSNPVADFILSSSSKLLRNASMEEQRAVTVVPENSGGIQVWNGAEVLASVCVRGTRARKKFCVVSHHRTRVSGLGLPQSTGMLGIKRWTTFPRGQRKRERRRQGKEGPGRKWERERERGRVQGGGEMKGYYFFCICHFPAISHMTS